MIDDGSTFNLIMSAMMYIWFFFLRINAHTKFSPFEHREKSTICYLITFRSPPFNWPNCDQFQVGTSNGRQNFRLPINFLFFRCVIIYFVNEVDVFLFFIVRNDMVEARFRCKGSKLELVRSLRLISPPVSHPFVFFSLEKCRALFQPHAHRIFCITPKKSA